MTMVTISRHRKGIPAILRLFSYRRSILCIITLSLFSCYWSILSTTFTKSGEPIQPSSQKITITTIPDDNPKTSDSPKESINPQRIRPIKIKKPSSTTTTNDESTPDKPPLAAWKWSHNTSWCTPQNPTTISERPTTPLPPNPTGLIYVKVPKTASSTLSGIALRIAHHVGNRTLLQNNTNNNNQTTTNNNITPCTNLVRHLNMKTNETYATRKPPPDSFLWSMIRDPLKRQLSAVFHFKISRRDVKPTDANVKKLMSSDNPQLNYLAFDRSPEGMISTAQPPFAHLHRKGGGGGRNAAWILSNNKELTTILPSHVSRIVDGYDFIGITERINESLVVLKFLLGLETTDILYLNAKASGGYDDGEFQDRCVKIQKSFVSEGVKKFLEGRQWKTSVRGDELLYEMVNRKLDATIEEIGKERFREALEEFEEVLRRGDEMCADEAVFPCSKEGVLQREEAEKSCYWADSGCGYPCLDTISV